MYPKSGFSILVESRLSTTPVASRFSFLVTFRFSIFENSRSPEIQIFCFCESMRFDKCVCGPSFDFSEPPIFDFGEIRIFQKSRFSILVTSRFSPTMAGGRFSILVIFFSILVISDCTEIQTFDFGEIPNFDLGAIPSYCDIWFSTIVPGRQFMILLHL